MTPEVQQQLVHDLLQTCRQAPEALAAVVPYLGQGAAALMKGLKKQQQQQQGGGGGVGLEGGMVMPELALPLVVEETLTVTQARVFVFLLLFFFGGGVGLGVGKLT